MRTWVLAMSAALLALTACTSTAAGHGSAGTLSASSTSAPASASAATSAAATSSPTVVRTSSSTRSSGSPGTTHVTSVSVSASSAAAAQVLNVSYVVTCTSHTDTAGTVKLTWTTKGATEVYLEAGQVASVLVGADPRSSGGKGPFPPNSSSVQPYDCAQDYGYYLVEAYNGSSRAGVVQQVPYS